MGNTNLRHHMKNRTYSLFSSDSSVTDHDDQECDCECQKFIDSNKVQNWLLQHGFNRFDLLGGGMTIDSLEKSLMLSTSYAEFFQSVQEFVNTSENQKSGHQSICKKHGLDLYGIDDKRGRGLKEKLAEMETFRDILCRQIDTLQSYFDSCASAVQHGAAQDMPDDIEDDIDLDHNAEVHSLHVENLKLRGKDLESILKQHGGHSVDFKGEAFTFKATTAGIISTLSHCIELMQQREEAWKKRLEREADKRKKYEEAYKSMAAEKREKLHVVGGPDYEEGPHCMITEDEFYDAVDATLDKLEKEEEKKIKDLSQPTKPDHKIALSPSNAFYKEINDVIVSHLRRLLDETNDEWQCIADQGDLKVFKRELEENGIVLDPVKAECTVKKITGHEVCKYFWEFDTRLEWESTLENTQIIEWLSEDTFINNNIIRRVWPASQRDACFWSHIRHVTANNDEGPDKWIVVNYSCDHPKCPATKYVRITMNVAMICQTIIEPPANGNITRDNITCKITYTADVNPGGWAPASVLRSVYKREYPKFLRRFTQYVLEKTADKPILF